MITESVTIVEKISTDNNGPVIEIKGLYKSFGQNDILKGVDLTIQNIILSERFI